MGDLSPTLSIVIRDESAPDCALLFFSSVDLISLERAVMALVVGVNL